MLSSQQPLIDALINSDDNAIYRILDLLPVGHEVISDVLITAMKTGYRDVIIELIRRTSTSNELILMGLAPKVIPIGVSGSFVAHNTGNPMGNPTGNPTGNKPDEFEIINILSVSKDIPLSRNIFYYAVLRGFVRLASIILRVLPDTINNVRLVFEFSMNMDDGSNMLNMLYTNKYISPTREHFRMAIMNGNQPNIKLLLRYVIPDQKDLYLTVSMGMTWLVKTILQYGVDVTPEIVQLAIDKKYPKISLILASVNR